MYRKNNLAPLLLLTCLASVPASGHPPDPKPEPYSWIPRHLIVRDRIYAATAVIGDVTLGSEAISGLTGGLETELHSHVSTEYLTDDRGPGAWAASSDMFSVSLTYETRHLSSVNVGGLQWYLVQDGWGGYVPQYSDEDASAMVGFTLVRSPERTRLAQRDTRVEWWYESAQYDPDAIGIGGVFLQLGISPGSQRDGVERFGGFGL